MSEKLLTTEEVAQKLDVSMNTLQIWRHKGKGPKYVRLSRRAVRYRGQDVQAWIDNSVVETEVEN